MGNVINMADVQPKTINKRYKNHSFVITYLPQTKEWHWTVTYVHTTVWSDTAKSIRDAQRAAEKHIDKTLMTMGEK